MSDPKPKTFSRRWRRARDDSRPWLSPKPAVVTGIVVAVLAVLGELIGGISLNVIAVLAPILAGVIAPFVMPILVLVGSFLTAPNRLILEDLGELRRDLAA